MSRDIFLSYRRDESRQAERLSDHLVSIFGREAVSDELNYLEPGDDYALQIDCMVSQFRLVLVVIGPRWAEDTDSVGRRLLDQPDNFIRLELASALARGIPVIPILVDGATMPRHAQLPDDIGALSYHNAVTLSDTSWNTDIAPLIKLLKSPATFIVPAVEPPRVPAPSLPPSPVSRPYVNKSAPATDVGIGDPISFNAYVGNEPFIFVSYAHHDRDRVMPELKALHDQGFRIWYDEGILVGSEWPEDIANALTRASVFLVFISPDAVTSRNVRNEIYLALSHEKPFLAVYLENTPLPDGLELSIGRIQAISKWSLSTIRYTRKLLASLPLACQTTPDPANVSSKVAVSS